MNNEYHRNEIAIKNLATNLISHIFSNGALNLDKCIEISNALQNWGHIIDQKGSEKPIEANAHLPSIDQLKRELSLPSRGMARIFHLLMVNAGHWINMNEVALKLNLSPKSIRVLISVMRKHLRSIDLVDIVQTEYRAGYSISHKSVDEILLRLNSTEEASV